MYKLLDRFVLPGGEHVIRAQHSITGECVDVHVLPQDAEIAALHMGGADIPVVRRSDGRLQYWRHPDLLTEAEADALDRRLALAAARRAAGPAPSDEQLVELLDRPGLSYRQRWAAIRDLGSPHPGAGRGKHRRIK